MKYIIYFLFIPLFALEINVNTTDEYSILNIKNNSPFTCKAKNKKVYICKFNKLPSAPVFETESVFFKIKPIFKKDKFYLKIESKYNLFAKPFKKNLYENYKKRLINLNNYKKIVFISYKNSLPFLSQKKITGLTFPLEIDYHPYVGAIDTNGNPINYDLQTKDVKDYFYILSRYKKHILDIDTLDEFLNNYKNSVFTPDILYLKIKLLDEEENVNEVIKLANLWIKKYSFNEHLPEIILILAKNYANNGDLESATYMYERLFTEYAGTKYAYKGMIYLADQLYSSGDNKRAFSLYKKALINTKDLDIASLAAFRLAQRYLTEGDIKNSVLYYNKLFESNKNFILKDKKSAYEIINDLAKQKYKPALRLAIKIGKALLKKLNIQDDLYEPLLYKLALLNYEINDFKEALKFVNLYLDKFPYGDYSDNIKSLKDKIVFQIPENNTTLMLKRYNEIIEKYKDTKLAKKALINKINLLYKLKKYEEILKYKNEDINKTIIINSAKYAVINDLNNSCQKAIKIYKEFNITLDKKYDEALFKCAYKMGALKIASQIPNKYLISRNKKIALKWLKNKAKVFELENNYKELALIIDDICSLQKKNCYKYRYKQFFAYYYLNKPKEFLSIAAKFLNNDNIKNIDVFMKVVLYAQKINNTLLAYTYAKKILNLEKKYNTFIQSPQIDFIFVDVAKKLHKKNEAIKVLKNLLKLNIDEDSKARAYYLLASLTTNSNYLKKCIKLKNSKTWMPLCKQALEVLQ